MGTITADMRPLYERARVRAKEIWLETETQITMPAMRRRLEAEGFAFVQDVTLRAWKRQDHWVQSVGEAAANLDRTAKVLLGMSQIHGRSVPVTEDTISQLERFHSLSITAGQVMAEKLISWASRLNPAKMDVNDGSRLMREIIAYEEAMVRLKPMIADAKHHMPTVKPAPGGKAEPLTIEGEAADAGFSGRFAKITEDVAA